MVSELAKILLVASDTQSASTLRDCFKVYDAIEAWKEAQGTVAQIVQDLCDRVSAKNPHHAEQVGHPTKQH